VPTSTAVTTQTTIAAGPAEQRVISTTGTAGPTRAAGLTRLHGIHTGRPGQTIPTVTAGTTGPAAVAREHSLKLNVGDFGALGLIVRNLGGVGLWLRTLATR
jgi:hypothetical protein